jgi:hypothetical protein
MYTCNICGCFENETHKMTNSKKWNMILCGKHYQQLKRHNKIIDESKQERNRNDVNEIIIYDNYAEIILYNIQGNPINKAIIDLNDVERCSMYKWCIESKNNYVCTTIDSKHVKLHRFIMNVVDDNNNIVVDHIDRNPLNNIKYNLRCCTSQENARNKNIVSTNKSGVMGVRWDDKRQKWYAYIRINNKNIFLGRYEVFQYAVNARKEAEEKYFGEFKPVIK